jgi:carboxymethylenebutenolidase
MTTRPDTDSYDDVELATIDLPVRDGTTISSVFARPVGDGKHPAVVICAEGTGINTFIRRLAATLAHEGYVTIVPDYYRGDGPPSPDDYDDFATLMEYIGALDFRRAIHDVVDGAAYLRSLPYVDASRIASWGYCTGGTLALFVACLVPDLAASVVFFPSQPTFDELTPMKPVHAADLLWNIACPVLFLVGGNDAVLPPVAIEELRARLDTWGIDAHIEVYEGALHAFNAPGSSMYDQHADERSWEDATAFLAGHLHPRPGRLTE